MDFHWPIESIFTTGHSCPCLLSLATKDLSPHPRAVLSFHALTQSSFFRFSFQLLENTLSFFLPFQLLFLCPVFGSFFLFPHFGHFQSLLINFLLLSLDDVFSGNQNSSFSNLLCVEHIQESTPTFSLAFVHISVIQAEAQGEILYPGTSGGSYTPGQKGRGEKAITRTQKERTRQSRTPESMQ